jgi:peptidoglycan/xylan/chitin deacetylase (PgdA/CDA1 family)
VWQRDPVMTALSGTVAASLVSAGALAWGAFERNSPLFGRVQRRLHGRDAVVALTFDDGPNPQATPSVLDALGEGGVRATFFVLGRHADRWPSLVRRMREEGHVIANHGYHHRKLTFRSPRYVRDDIARGTAAIQRAGGSRPALFRAPHGHRNPWVTSIARAAGQRTVGWTLGVWDSARPGASIIADRAIRGAEPGAIILLHDGDGYDAFGDRTQTAAALPAIIRGLRERGFAFVGLD